MLALLLIMKIAYDYIKMVLLLVIIIVIMFNAKI